VDNILNITGTIIVLAIVIYIGFASYLALFQSRFIYFPEEEITLTPTAIGLPYDNVVCKTDDGIKLHGWFIPAEKHRGVLLFCHGNAGNVSHRLETIRLFNRLGLSTFIFDYRGYGNSEGKPTEKGTYFDAEAAWKYLIQERSIKSSEIIIFGKSLGGAVAAWLAHKHTPVALIIESTFTSIRDLGAKLYPLLPVRLLSRFNYNTADYLRNVNCPVLIMHSREDEFVPFYHGRQLYESANKPKEFFELEGLHNDGFVKSAGQYENNLHGFIAKYIGN